MKRALLLAGLLLAVSRWSGASEAFDPGVPISLELKDASLGDVITTLGALANLPVVIEPGIEGRVTIRLQDVPFERVLAILSKQNGITLHVLDGKLVASRSLSSVPGPALLPEKFQGLPRIAVEEYSKSLSPPLFVETRWNASETCNRLTFGNGGVSTALIPAPGRTRSLPMLVSQFGFDPVTGARFVVADDPLRRVFALQPGSSKSAEIRSDAQSLRVTVAPSPMAAEGCQGPDQRESGPRPNTMIVMEVRERLEDGSMRAVMGPRVAALAGVAFSMRSSFKDRGFVIRGYLSRDGGSVALALVVEATWSDPRDGRDYIYAQVGDVREQLVPLTPDGVMATSLPAGVATDRPLELWVSLGSFAPEKSGAAPPKEFSPRSYGETVKGTTAPVFSQAMAMAPPLSVMFTKPIVN
jgi:hypothetical protein